VELDLSWYFKVVEIGTSSGHLLVERVVGKAIMACHYLVGTKFAKVCQSMIFVPMCTCPTHQYGPNKDP
jgi:hypothetical protein